MGTGFCTDKEWTAYASSIADKPASAIFTSHHMADEFNPAKFALRESRDAGKGMPVPFMIGSDVTGSMGKVADHVLRHSLHKTVTELFERGVVPDPQVLLAAIGDAESDDAPLQVGQFEGNVLLAAAQAEKFWIEGGGGANAGESYLMLPLLAAMKTSTDAAEIHHRKGYVFTIGDEPPLDGVTRAQAAKFLGLDLQANLSGRDIVEMVSRNWHYFHIVLINEGACKYSRSRVLETWNRILPGNTIELQALDNLAETIVSLIQVTEGASKDVVAASWSGGTELVVANAIRNLPGRPVAGGGLVRL